MTKYQLMYDKGCAIFKKCPKIILVFLSQYMNALSPVNLVQEILYRPHLNLDRVINQTDRDADPRAENVQVTSMLGAPFTVPERSEFPVSPSSGVYIFIQCFCKPKALNSP